jgi:hypothetical protein
MSAENQAPKAKAFVMVNPITQKPTNLPLPEWVTPILAGQWQNAVEVEGDELCTKGEAVMRELLLIYEEIKPKTDQAKQCSFQDDELRGLRQLIEWIEEK